MKSLRYLAIVLTALGLLFALTALTAAAQGVSNTSPTTAAVIDGQTHQIAANSSLWYRFDYAGDRSHITVTLPNGNGSGLAFNVFTPAQIGDWWDTKPIGRGTAYQINCETGEPQPNGQCQSNDLTWDGQFNAPGTYYVEVVNTTGSPLNFQLTIQGTGVTLAPIPAATQPATASAPTAAPPTPAPTATAAPATATNTDPGHALALPAGLINLPANGSLWYQFSYSGDRSQIVITLPGGNASGVRFNVWTPQQVGDWWEQNPIGRGTAQAINCDTGKPQTNGACQSNDLDWSGNFNAAGTYYVQVINTNTTPVTAQLLVQGSGVNASQ